MAPQTPTAPAVPGYAQRVAQSMKNRVLVARVSRQQIADVLGVRVGTVSRRLGGTQEWTLSELEAVAPLLGVEDPADLARP